MKQLFQNIKKFAFIAIISLSIPMTSLAGSLIPDLPTITENPITNYDDCFSNFSLLKNSSYCTPKNPIFPSSQCDHSLTQAEQNDGFELLFDGSANSVNNNWMTFGESQVRGWNIQSGCLTLAERGVTLFRKTRDIMTKKDYSNFELRLDWKVRVAGNSGIFVREAPFRRAGNFTDGDRSAKNFGYEMQILSSFHYDGFINPTHTSGSIYNIYPGESPLSLDGAIPQWRSVRIIANGPSYEYYLDDDLIVEFTVGSSEWLEAMQTSSLPTSGPDWNFFGTRSSGRIMLQDHWDRVQFRNIRIKELPATTPFTPTPF